MQFTKGSIARRDNLFYFSQKEKDVCKKTLENKMDFD